MVESKSTTLVLPALLVANACLACGPWFVRLAQSQGGVGPVAAGFWRIDKDHFRAEIGYDLAPERWGRGIMPEALRPILGFGFATLGLHSVEANIDPANGGSRRVLEKLGFAQEGYFRENYYLPDEDRFTDTATFSLLAGDWARH